ncbi:MAG TPA: UMP kinase [Candidatus Brocadiia bacterium]|nr:UMP kinase [Planctomycetota bacterium]MDO8093201.1 UMP kinase [Candidatus Brocadiales bacterium]
MVKGKTRYTRVLLKISGEGFCSEKNHGVEKEDVDSIASEIERGSKIGAEIAVVVGGGNIFRGSRLNLSGVDRTRADQLGMIATTINALVLQGALEDLGLSACVQSAIGIQEVIEPYSQQVCMERLKEGCIVILAGGTGNPYFTTDTAAALRAMEIGANVLLKATKVDGVYSADPLTNPEAKKYEELSYIDVLSKNLKIMDTTAITLCMEHKLPIIVFNLKRPRNIERAIKGERIGTYIGE